jgi:hypothetical protein
MRTRGKSIIPENTEPSKEKVSKQSKPKSKPKSVPKPEIIENRKKRVGQKKPEEKS